MQLLNLYGSLPNVSGHVKVFLFKLKLTLPSTMLFNVSYREVLVRGPNTIQRGRRLQSSRLYIDKCRSFSFILCVHGRLGAALIFYVFGLKQREVVRNGYSGGTPLSSSGYHTNFCYLSIIKCKSEFDFCAILWYIDRIEPGNV